MHNYKSYLKSAILIQTSLLSIPGGIDNSFGPNAKGIITLRKGKSTTTSCTAILPDDSFFATITAEIFGFKSWLALFDRNGNLSTSFGNNGMKPIAPQNSIILTTMALHNNNIIIGGSIYMNQTEFFLAQYDTMGNLDPNFGTHGYTHTAFGTGCSMNSLKIQPNGYIVACGTYIENFPIALLARYDIQGKLDQSFGNCGITTVRANVQSHLEDLIIQPDGKIIACGFSFNGYYHEFLLIRFNTDGSLDKEFGNFGIVTTTIGQEAQATGITLQKNGDILVCGHVIDNANRCIALVRYDKYGNPDHTFNNSGIVITSVGFAAGAQSILLMEDENILIGGYSIEDETKTFTLIRYLSSGKLDTTFGINGIITTSVGENAWIENLIMQSTGAIIAAGSSDNKVAFVRYTTK